MVTVNFAKRKINFRNFIFLNSVNLFFCFRVFCFRKISDSVSVYFMKDGPVRQKDLIPSSDQGFIPPCYSRRFYRVPILRHKSKVGYTNKTRLANR